MKQRIRINESQLNQIVAESVERCLMEQGLGDRLRGAAQGFQKGKDAIQSNERGNAGMTDNIVRTYEILSGADITNVKSLRDAVRNAIRCLEASLEYYGFKGFSNGSGTEWKDKYKPLHDYLHKSIKYPNDSYFWKD